MPIKFEFFSNDEITGWLSQNLRWFEPFGGKKLGDKTNWERNAEFLDQ